MVMKDKKTATDAMEKKNLATWARQWHIIKMIIDCPEGRTLKELAVGTGATILTVYRDLKILQSVLGPFRTRNKAHGEKAYSLTSSSISFAPTLNRDEMIALAVGGVVLSSLDKTSLGRGFESAFQKMGKVLDYQDLDFATKIKMACHVKTGSKVRFDAQVENIDKILRAIVNHRILKVVYHSPLNRGKKDYEIHPYTLFYCGGLLYLVGWSGSREKVCAWRVDRFYKLRILLRTFEPPQDFDLKKILSAGAYPFLKEDKTITAKILFKRDIRQEVLDEDEMVVKTEKRKNGQTLADVIVDNKRTFFRWLFQFEDHATILGPNSLRAEMNTRLTKMLQCYDKKKESEE